MADPMQETEAMELDDEPEAKLRDSMPEFLEKIIHLTAGHLKETIDGAKEFLKKEFPDWESGCRVLFPVVMREKEKDGDEAELLVMKKILEFSLADPQPMFVVMNTKTLSNNMESDVVVIHRYAGVKILEIKKPQGYRYMNKRINEAFKQVEKGKEKIREIYENAFGEFPVGIFGSSPGFACVPCHKLDHSDRRKPGVLSADECESAGSFKSWWENYIFGKEDPLQKPLSRDVYLNLLSMFIGAWCFQESINNRNVGWLIEETAKLLRHPAEEGSNPAIPIFVPPHLRSAMDWVRTADASRDKRRVIAGVAGTGKTWILTESAARILAEDFRSRVLVLCFNRPLAIYLRNEIHRSMKKKLGGRWKPVGGCRGPSVTVDTFFAFMGWKVPDAPDPDEDFNRKEALKNVLKMRGEDLKAIYGSYSHVFIDESINLCFYNSVDEGKSTSWLGLLENIWDETGCFFLSFDLEQCVYSKIEVTDREREYLGVSQDLKQVIRSPSLVCDSFLAHASKETREKKIPTRECPKVLGMPVVYCEPYLRHVSWSDCDVQGIENVVRIIEEYELRDVKEFVILTETRQLASFVGEGLKRALSKLKHRHSLCDAATLARSHGSAMDGERRIVVDTVRRYQGLQGSVVILFGLPSGQDPLMYLGKSRCSGFLFVVGTEGACEEMRQKEKVYKNEVTPSISRKRKEEPEGAPSLKWIKI